MSYNDNLKITGPSFALSYKRTTYKPLDASSVFETYKDAVTYANNMLPDYQFVPYPGQMIAVISDPTESNNNVYKLVKDITLTLGDGDTRNHCRLEPIGGLDELKETFTLRDNEEKIEKIWEFLAGLRVLGVLNADDVKAVTVTVDKGEENPQQGGKTYVQSGGYIRGGKGFGIYKDANGSWCLDIDNVQVRGSLAVSALKVNQTDYLGGEVILTVGGSIEATEVEETDGGAYKVYFKNSDGNGREIFCQMTAGDLAKHQTYNDKTGSRLYWLKVDEMGSDYVVLSRLEGDTTAYSTPRAGDEIVHLGNVSDKTRQTALIFSARTQSMRIYTGIDTTSLGNATAPIDLNPVESKILAKFITMSTGVSLDKAFTDVRDRMGVLEDDVAAVKSQSDKQFVIWFTDYTPTLNNKPYTDWIADGKDESFDINDWQPATKATTTYLAQLADQILAFATNTNQSITDIQGKLQTAQDTATQAAFDAARGIGLANAAQEAADSAMTALQVTDRNVTALVGGDYLNADGTVKESYRGIIDTTASYVAALAQNLTFDENGLVTNIDRSGLVLESTWAAMFSDTTDENGTVVARAQISTLIDDGVSKAVIKADQVEIDGTVRINQYITADKNGNLTLGKKTESGTYDVNALTVYGNGEFTGTVNATGGVFSNVQSKNGTWMIDEEGNFKATSGEFKGKITATSGTFNNITSTGGYFQILEDGSFVGKKGTLDGVTVGTGDGQITISTDSNGNGQIASKGGRINLGQHGFGLYGERGYLLDGNILMSLIDGAGKERRSSLFSGHLNVSCGEQSFAVAAGGDNISIFMEGLPKRKEDALLNALYLSGDTLKVKLSL